MTCFSDQVLQLEIEKFSGLRTFASSFRAETVDPLMPQAPAYVPTKK